MNFIIFLISVTLSTIGAFFDFYSTSVAIKEGLGELERNEMVRNDFFKSNFRKHIYLETFIIWYF